MAYLITEVQRRGIFACLRQLAWDDYRANLVSQFGGGKGSINELTQQEASALWKHLQENVAKLQAAQPAPDMATNNQKLFLYQLMGALGWKGPKGLDFEKLNHHLNTIAVVKKPIKHQTKEEMSKTLSQLQSMLANNTHAEASKAVAEVKKELGF